MEIPVCECYPLKMLICVFYERPDDDTAYVPKYQTVCINICYISVQGMNRIYEINNYSAVC